MFQHVDLIVRNGKITTFDRNCPQASTAAVKDGRFVAAGTEEDLNGFQAESTIDLNGRCVIPGLNDSHLHLIRGGLNFNMELRWDGVPSLADALTMLRDQARRTPPPQWVRVVGGWTWAQFAERRLPTMEEINEATGETPAFILHLYDRAWINAAALRAVGYTKETPDPPGSVIERDRHGNPTGLLIAKPNAGILYSTLARGPRLNLEDQINSTRHFMREMNRLGLTSAIDAGGGFQNFPEDYQVVQELERRGELTVRLAYNLFTQKPKQEKDDFARWVRMIKPGDGSRYLRMNGAGEMLVFSAADFEDFVEPRPNLAGDMETELEEVVRILASNRWPFRLHATYDESISRMLNVFERVNQDIPFNGLHWFFDHAETITDRNIERVRAMGGGIAIQHRMAYQGEAFVQRYGAASAQRTPPVRRMLQLGVPVGAGTDATRVASYNPWVALHWLTTGETVGGLRLYPEKNTLSRTEALQLYTKGSSWFSNEQEDKGSIRVGEMADLAVLSADYFSVPDPEVKQIESVLTIVGGKVVFGSQEFHSLQPPMPRVSPDWSPVGTYGGYHKAPSKTHSAKAICTHQHGAGDLLPEGLFCPCFAF